MFSKQNGIKLEITNKKISEKTQIFENYTLLKKKKTVSKKLQKKFLNILNSVKFGEGDGTPLQYSCLENPMDGGAW